MKSPVKKLKNYLKWQFWKNNLEEEALDKFEQIDYDTHKND